MTRFTKEFHEKRAELIADEYARFTMTVEKLAIKYNISTRSIQRIAKAKGVVRTIAEANKIAAPFKNYEGHKVPEHLKKKRKSIPQWLRYKTLRAHPWCKVCGATGMICPLQVDHIDGDATNNNESNFQVLCMECNYGKAWVDHPKLLANRNKVDDRQAVGLLADANKVEYKFEDTVCIV